MLLTQKKGNTFTPKFGALWRQCTLADKHGSQAKSCESLEAPLTVEAPEGVCQDPPKLSKLGIREE